MTRKVLITGATGDTGRSAVKESLARGLQVRAMVHGEDARSVALRALGAEVVLGDHHAIDAVRSAMQGTEAAYFVYPVQPGLIEATVNFAQAAKEAGVGAIVNLSQRSASRSSTSHACRDTWIAERVLDWSGSLVPWGAPLSFRMSRLTSTATRLQRWAWDPMSCSTSEAPWLTINTASCRA